MSTFPGSQPAHIPGQLSLEDIMPEHIAKSKKLGALRRFDVRCENTLRRVSYTIIVFATDQQDACWTARQYIKDNNLVAAERMVTPNA